MDNKYLVVLVAFLLCVGSVFAAIPSPFDVNFIAGWNFDDAGNKLDDINSTLDHNGTVAGTIDINFYSLQANAKNGTSYDFNNTYATVTDSTGVFKATQFSGMTWFQTTSTGNHTLFASMANRTVLQSAGWFITIELGQIKFYMGSVDGASTETVLQDSYSGSVADGAWHQLIWTYSGGVKRLFIDGALMGTESAGLAYNATNYTAIGAFRVNGAYEAKFDGNLDSTYFWDRNLSLTEIATLWNGGAGTFFGGTHANTLTNSITSPAIGTTQTGFMDVNFSIRDTNASIATITSSIYLSTTAGAKTTLVYTDSNIADGVGVTCNAYIPFTTARNCTYRFDSSAYSDGNYYVDVNSYTIIDGNLASLGPFRIDNSFDEVPPVVGPTTLTEFALTGAFISGVGNVIGGFAYDAPDYEFGKSFTLLKNDSNLYQAIATDTTGKYIYAVTSAGFLVDSNDYGVTWRQELNNGNARYGVAISDQNSIIAVTSIGGKIDISRDLGQTWSAVDSNEGRRHVVMSSTGQYILTNVNPVGTGIFLSTDWGATFSQVGPNLSFNDVTIDSTGQYMLASGYSGFSYRSDDYGANWTAIESLGTGQWLDVTLNKTGEYAFIFDIATKKGYVSSNYGQSWTHVLTAPSGYLQYIYNAVFSSNGQLLLVPIDNKMYSSINYGIDFNINTLSIEDVYSVTISNSSYSYAASTAGGILVQNREARGLNTASCQYTTNNGLTWSNADWNDATQSCVKYGVSVTPGLTYTFNTRIQDLAGNYGYGTATISRLAASGSAIQFLVVNETDIPQSNVDINLFTLDGGGARTPLTSIHTDISGIAFAILDLGTTYGIDVYQAGELVLSSNNVTIVSSSYKILIPTQGNDEAPPDVNAINVNWNPGIDYVYNDVINLVQTITSVNVTDVNILIYQYADWNSSIKNQLYSAAAACNQNCTVTTPLAAFTIDYNKPFYVDINLGVSGYSNRYIVTHKYVRPSSAEMTPLLDLFRNVRADFSCSLDVNYPCGLTIIISIILTILLIASIVMLTGYAGPQGIAIVALVALGIFSYIGWFYWIAYAVIVIIALLSIGKGVVE